MKLSDEAVAIDEEAENTFPLCLKKLIVEESTDPEQIWMIMLFMVGKYSRGFKLQISAMILGTNDSGNLLSASILIA